MARVDDYRRILLDLLQKYAAEKPSLGEIEVEAVFDEVKDHYEITYAGWVRDDRIHGPILHVDIRGGKIWIQHDGTEGGIAEELVALGVPRDDIVLAFHPPDERRYTGFAVS
ncbi:MAG: element excision factor XisI family protein [Candidatus Xenobia bacterium]